MVIMKATKNSEAGIMPDEQLITQMTEYNEALVAAGIMLSGDGLHPSSQGKRIRFADGKQTVTDGPFAALSPGDYQSELIAGFWIWQVKDMDEALGWIKRCPHPMPGEEAEIELRPIFEMEDFGDEMTPELREREARMRGELGE